MTSVRTLKRSPCLFTSSISKLRMLPCGHSLMSTETRLLSARSPFSIWALCSTAPVLDGLIGVDEGAHDLGQGVEGGVAGGHGEVCVLTL